MIFAQSEICRQGLWLSTASTSNEYSDWIPVRNCRFLLMPPKQGSAQGCGRTIRPSAHRHESSNAPRPFPIPRPTHTQTHVPVATRPYPIRNPRRHVRKHLAAPQLPARHHPEHPDVPRSIGIVRIPSIGDVDQRLVWRRAQPVWLHQVARGNSSYTGYRSPASRESRVGHLRPSMTARQSLRKSWLEISICGRRREPSLLELASPFQRLPHAIGLLHPQPCLTT